MTQQDLIQITFPSGKVGHEILHFMGVDHPQERPIEAQELIKICEGKEGKRVSIPLSLIPQLIGEVDNAIDIKRDQVIDIEWERRVAKNTGSFIDEDFEWLPRDQKRLEKFYDKLAGL